MTTSGSEVRTKDKNLWDYVIDNSLRKKIIQVHYHRARLARKTQFGVNVRWCGYTKIGGIKQFNLNYNQ